jgi:energy-coupling factor transporter ATP-binding protein EcfA2
MYVDQLDLRRIRTFRESKLDFVYPGRFFRSSDPARPIAKRILPKPRLNNVNLLLGDNGSGKSTALRAIALLSLGPAITQFALAPNDMIRRGESNSAIISKIILHEQDLPDRDGDPEEPFREEITSVVAIVRRRDMEVYEFDPNPKPGADPVTRRDGENLGFVSSMEQVWDVVYETNNESFFVVGYGATRRVERPETFDMGARMNLRFPRAQRVRSLFEDSFSLIPLTYWLPKLQSTNPERFKQVADLLNAFLKPVRYTFSEEMEKEDYLFERGGNRVPFLSMSDGLRAFIGWVADLLYHICSGCPSGKSLVESRGIVLVDEIDLHLHPKWQMTVIRAVARALPRMQFIFTSHSPLVAGSLELMNIIALKLSSKTNRTIAKRLNESIHGLDADQVLLTDFFGLKTTRAPGKVSQLEALERKARHGDQEAARKIILAMSRGMEESP